MQYVESAALAIPEETRAILSYAKNITGKDFDFYADSNLQTWATVKPARNTMPVHIVRYNPKYADKLPYLLAHEAGHLIRMWSAPLEQRKIPAGGEAELKRWADMLYREMPREARLRSPKPLADKMISILQTGLMVQVTNTPADMRIERWLWEEHPALADYQTDALLGQIHENYRVLDNNIRAFSPPSVFKANNTMNAAYAYYISRLLLSDLAERYRATGFYDDGKKLADEVWNAPDQGHLSDIADTERWAKLFGLDKILEWREFEDVPEGYFR